MIIWTHCTFNLELKEPTAKYHLYCFSIKVYTYVALTKNLCYKFIFLAVCSCAMKEVSKNFLNLGKVGFSWRDALFFG